MLVGDAKQAIYRWRGGKAEQFIGLYTQDNPFQIEKHIEQLPKNYRSAQEIVRFNNGFFKYLSTFAFSDSSYQSVYESSFQEPIVGLQGYVNINFLNISRDDDVDFIYTNKTLQTVYSCLDKGYKASDICILTRKRKEGIAIAKFLTNAGINITSSETLLIDNSSKVKFIINLLYFVSDTNNLIKKLDVLSFIGNEILALDNIHEFYKLHVSLSLEKLFKAFADLGMTIELDQITHSPLYEAIEAIIHGFSLNKESDAYVQFFLDFAFDYSIKKNTSILNFIEHYNNQKENLSIVSSESQDAIRVMTIHKAKGLEFPVVIFPFADLDIYREKNPKIWLPINNEEFHDFPVTYVNYNKTLVDINEVGEVLYYERQAELELDNINLLYVALTRPIEQLYIISNNRIDKSGSENLKHYSGLLISYLKQQQLWNPSQQEYAFGNNEKKLKAEEKETSVVKISDLISTPKQANNIQIVTNSGNLWDTQQQNAIEKGNLIHDLMAMIKTEVDIDIALNHFRDLGTISTEQVDELSAIIEKVVKHPDLSYLFDSKNTIYNEREIITPKGEILRPDRIVISPSQETTILDYKTGAYNSKHKQQLYTYSNVLNQMNQNVAKRILVYINDNLEIKEV
jgi:ATP-dependent exoDNAse (exonuclease V) beta subunit